MDRRTIKPAGIEQSLLAPVESKGEVILAPVWQVSQKAQKALDYLRAIPSRVNANLSARTPVICRGEDCPYVMSCEIPESLRPREEPCPIEIDAVTRLTTMYCRELKIGLDNMIDYTLVRDLVDLDVMIMRAQGIMAKEPDIIQMVIADIDKQGRVHRNPEVHKAVQLVLQLIKERRQILDTLHATRKAKASNDKESITDASKRAQQLMEKLRLFEEQQPEIANGAKPLIIDVTPGERVR